MPASETGRTIPAVFASRKTGCWPARLAAADPTATTALPGATVTLTDPAAAFPSLHAAYPLLAALALWPVTRRGAALALAWTLAVWFSVVYLGQHYVTDIIGGIAFAVGTWMVLTQLAAPLVPALRRQPAGSGEHGPSEYGPSEQNSTDPGTAERETVEVAAPPSSRGAD